MKNLKNISFLKKVYTIDQINEYLNIMKKLGLEEEKKTSNKCFYENKEITVIDQCGKVELCRDCGIIIQKILIIKALMIIIAAVIIKRKVFTKENII